MTDADAVYASWTNVNTDPVSVFTGDTLPSLPVSLPSASSLIDSIGSAVGRVADIGFGIQNVALKNQSQAQDLQLKQLMANLGFKTAAIQAQSQAQVAQINAQAQVAQAQRAATGGGGVSLPMLALAGFGLYLATKK